MKLLTVSEKGQLTLPVRARKALGITARSKVEVEIGKDQLVIRPLKTIREVRGILREFSEGKRADWGKVRRQAERAVAKEVANEDKR